MTITHDAEPCADTDHVELPVVIHNDSARGWRKVHFRCSSTSCAVWRTSLQGETHCTAPAAAVVKVCVCVCLCSALKGRTPGGI